MANPPKRWTVEYAPKASRLATCKTCEKPIEKEVLRIGRTLAARKFDGLMTTWNHADCFLEKQGQFQTLHEVKGVYDLRWGDQQKIHKYVGGLGQSSGGSTTNDNNNEYAMEKAKSSHATCKSCKKKIVKGEVSISDNSKFSHAKCFVETGMWRSPMEKMPGWDSLTNQDKQSLQTIADESNQDSGKKSKKRKRDEREALPLKKQINALWKKQTNALWKIKDELQKHVKTKELREMLKANDQNAASLSEYVLRERCADGMLFGALGKCSICDGRFEYSNGQYKCLGHVSPWTKCTFSITERLKVKWQIPKKEDNEYLSEWFLSQKEIKPLRILPPQSSKNPLENEGTKELSENSETAFLKGLRVAIIGYPNETISVWKSKLEAAGGKVVDSVTEVADCLVTNESQIDKYRSQIRNAVEMQVPVLKESFLYDCLEKKKRLLTDYEHIDHKVKVPSLSDLIDVEEREVRDSGHILKEGKSFYSAILNKCDLSNNINSYYILEVIEADKGAVYHVFRKWDRVGNNHDIRQLLEKESSKSNAIQKFKRLFREKTGNEWAINGEFQKKPDKYFPLYHDSRVDEKVDMRALAEKCKLDRPLIELMEILFDPETYRADMVKLGVKMSIMPLGKLDKRNIMKGYEVLTNVQNLIKLKDSDRKDSKLVDASNHFFTLIPTVHPLVIRNKADLKSNILMLKALEDIEKASDLIRFKNIGDDPFNVNYKKLHCKISPLLRDSPDYQLIKRYLKKTHAPAHDEWELELDDAYKIDRKGENKLKTKNRMLLWHGSRTTNFVNILRRGLQIAPPEAPATGYMFGKGIYFADLGSKSAKYCCTSKDNPVGFMLLSEVALGEVYERESEEYIEKLPEGKDSTKGVGRYKYLIEHEHWGDDHVIVPCGGIDPDSVIPPKDKDVLKFNEYIVYNTDQVKLQFLLKVRFRYKILKHISNPAGISGFKSSSI